MYGGLLDRCAVSHMAEIYKRYHSHDIDIGGGIAYFKKVSTTTNISISSGPVRVYICTNFRRYDCSYQSRVDVKKGEAFTVLLVAADQVGQLVGATIQAKNISAKFTNLTFNVISPYDLETLALYASNGPCRNVKYL